MIALKVVTHLKPGCLAICRIGFCCWFLLTCGALLVGYLTSLSSLHLPFFSVTHMTHKKHIYARTALRMPPVSQRVPVRCPSHSFCPASTFYQEKWPLRTHDTQLFLSAQSCFYLTQLKRQTAASKCSSSFLQFYSSVLVVLAYSGKCIHIWTVGFIQCFVVNCWVSRFAIWEPESLLEIAGIFHLLLLITAEGLCCGLSESHLWACLLVHPSNKTRFSLRGTFCLKHWTQQDSPWRKLHMKCHSCSAASLAQLANIIAMHR